jgi:hypothetical protein
MEEIFNFVCNISYSHNFKSLLTKNGIVRSKYSIYSSIIYIFSILFLFKHSNSSQQVREITRNINFISILNKKNSNKY